MNSVAAGSEFLTEFGSNNAATTVGRINRDADVHFRRTLQLLRTTDNRPQKVEAGDPRYRLPLSQLDSPSERGASEGGSICLLSFFSNEFCNTAASHS